MFLWSGLFNLMVCHGGRDIDLINLITRIANVNFGVIIQAKSAKLSLAQSLLDWVSFIIAVSDHPPIHPVKFPYNLSLTNSSKTISNQAMQDHAKPT